MYLYIISTGCVNNWYTVQFSNKKILEDGITYFLYVPWVLYPTIERKYNRDFYSLVAESFLVMKAFKLFNMYKCNVHQVLHVLYA